MILFLRDLLLQCILTVSITHTFVFAGAKIGVMTPTAGVFGSR